MSGGVDSSVTAALLKERGFDVVGVHIKMWGDPSIPCNFKEDRYDAMRVSEYLKIPFQTWDFTEEYRKAVVEYLIREYAAGRTPNPDVMCNRHIKFGVFLKRALAEGADFIATGHYVRLASESSFENTLIPPARDSLSIRRGAPITIGDHAAAPPEGFQKNFPRSHSALLKGIDPNKDQSYFLWTLTQEQLRHCLFPIGEFTKPEVRELARKFGLPTAEKKESQGICFIGEINLTEFLKKHIPMKRGEVVTTSGKKIGEHDGLAFYTIGQREGLGSGGGGVPYYVAKKDFKTNTLIVAEGPYDEKLFCDEVEVADVHWISGAAPKFPLECEARIRYRQPVQRCCITLIDANVTPNLHELIRENSWQNSYLIRVTFDEPQRAVTPGQSVVFYKMGSSGSTQDLEILGGGIIV